MDITRRRLPLKNPEHAVIAHISDLHFHADEAWQNGQAGAQKWSQLSNAVSRISPDIIVVTGDIVDSPNPQAFERAQAYLEHLCAYADVKPAQALFVVPGNHDCRTRGILKSSGIDDFLECFRQYMGSCIVTLFSQDQRDMTLAVTCLNSNDADANYLAQGSVSAKDLEQCEAFLTHKDVEAAYSIVLLHHHPAPIIASESKIDRLLEGAMILTNAGHVIDCMLRYGANLVLHGHKHWEGMTQLMSPAIPDHAVCVVGAGSVGKDAGSRLRFNEIRVRRSHVATVISHEAIPGSPYAAGTGTVLGAYDFTRIHRRKRLVRRMSSGLPWVATRIEHRLNIALNGDVTIFRAYRGLTARREGLSFLPITIKSQSASGAVAEPRVRRMDTSRYEIQFVASDGNGSTQGFRINPPMSRNDTLGDIEFETAMKGAFYHVYEDKVAATIKLGDRTAATERPQFEHWDFVHKDVLSEQLVRVLAFPPEFRARPELFDLRVQSLDYTGDVEKELEREEVRLDPEETEYARRGLIQSGPGEHLLVIPSPLPGYRYRLLWSLPKRADMNELLHGHHGENVLAWLATVRQARVGSARRRIEKGLEAICGEFRDAFKGGGRRVEAALFLVEENQSLNCIAATGSFGERVGDWAYEIRSGCVGQAAAQRLNVVHWPELDRKCEHHEASGYLSEARFILAMPVFVPDGVCGGPLAPVFGVLLVASNFSPKPKLIESLEHKLKDAIVMVHDLMFPPNLRPVPLSKGESVVKERPQRRHRGG